VIASRDCLDMVLPTNEAILEALIGLEKTWEDMHRRSYFLPDLDKVKSGEFHKPFSQ